MHHSKEHFRKAMVQLFLLAFAVKLNGGQVWDLKADWSERNNPNGAWSYRAGSSVLPHVDRWPLGPSLSGWAGRNLPFWFRAPASASTDWQKDDIIVHTQDDWNGSGYGTAAVVWTSPINGSVDISGGLWHADSTTSIFSGPRINSFNLSLRGAKISFGSIVSWDGHTRASPFLLAAGAGSPGALRKLAVSVGDQLRLEVARAATDGYFVGVNLTVIENVANTPPFISPILDQAVREKQGLAAIPFTISDAETPPGDLRLSSSSSNTSLLPTANITFGGSGTNRTVTLIPTDNQFGKTTVMIAVTDSGGFSTASSFQLTVTSNQPPTVVISSPLDGAAFQAPTNVTIVATAEDQDGHVSLVGLYTNDVRIGTFTNAPPCSMVLSNLAAGTYTITAKARDNYGLISTSAPVNITVTPPDCLDHTPSALIDLTNWRVLQYDFLVQPDARWELDLTRFIATQNVNADASCLLSDFDVANRRIQGNFRVESRDDDDFIGFVFAFQDDGHFYLFDWKGADQDDADFGYAERGMSIKIVHSDQTLNGKSDLWPSRPDPRRVRTLFHNKIPWETNVDYRFVLEFLPGSFTVTVMSGRSVLAAIPVADGTYTDGKFGFYNNSQRQVRYSGFTSKAIMIPPMVAITSPSTGTQFWASTNVTITADASACGGPVSAVEFLRDGFRIGEAALSPYTVIWTNVAAGTYSLTARAMDFRGIFSVSAPVRINVIPSQSGGARPGSLCGTNLIVNGNAEMGFGTMNERQRVDIPGWVTVGNLTALRYTRGISDGLFATPADPGPFDRGSNYFVGGTGALNSSAWQTIDVSDGSATIDAGRMQFTLSGFLGGWTTHRDNAFLGITFKSDRGNPLGGVGLGPVTAADRTNRTGLLFRTTSGAIPFGTRKIEVLLSMTFRRAPKLTVTQERRSLRQKGSYPVAHCFCFWCCRSCGVRLRDKTSRGAAVEPQLAPPCGRMPRASVGGRREFNSNRFIHGSSPLVFQ